MLVENSGVFVAMSYWWICRLGLEVEEGILKFLDLFQFY